MPNHDIQQEIINKIMTYYLDFGVSFQPDLKMASFKKKLERLSRTKLQGILDRIKPINYSQSAHDKLKLLKNIIQSTPNHEYKHLVPAINFFLYDLDSFTLSNLAPAINFLRVLDSFTFFSSLNLRVTLANRIKNIIANGDIERPNDFCNLIEENLLLLNDIGYLSLFESFTEGDSEFIPWGICVMLLTLTYAATAALVGLSATMMGLFPITAALFLILFLISVFLVGPMTYHVINFKLAKNNLNTCLENIEKDIKFKNQVSAWALLGLHESNNLPTDVVTHISSFFPDGNKIEAKILLRDKNKLDLFRNPHYANSML